VQTKQSGGGETLKRKYKKQKEMSRNYNILRRMNKNTACIKI
jgi:hypothetical protein